MHETQVAQLEASIEDLVSLQSDFAAFEQVDLERELAVAGSEDEVEVAAVDWLASYPDQETLIRLHVDKRLAVMNYEVALEQLANRESGAYLRQSYFARVGRAIEPVFEPLGWDWKITMATLAAFPAREVIIATLGTIYNLGAEVNDASTSLIDKMQKATWEDGPRLGQPVFTPATALSIMVFFALCCQCGATIVTIRQESGRWQWSVTVFLYMTVLAYISAYLVYQLFTSLGW
jgi:ferrous iron transport protein B